MNKHATVLQFLSTNKCTYYINMYIYMYYLMWLLLIQVIGHPQGVHNDVKMNFFAVSFKLVGCERPEDGEQPKRVGARKGEIQGEHKLFP